MGVDLLNGQMANIANILGAISALGLAAFGLVETVKLPITAISRAGFNFILGALNPFIGAIESPGQKSIIRDTLQANWMNGVPKDQQKAAAKALINLHLNAATAGAFAAWAGLNADALREAAAALSEGKELTDQQVNTVGRFNAILAASIDAGFERADRKYKDTTRTVAGLFSIILSLVAGYIIHEANTANAKADYAFSNDFWVALLVGFVAVPLAPIAKDLTTALNTAVSSLAKIRGK